MNNLDNMYLTYYGENIYWGKNSHYHEVQDQIKSSLGAVRDYIINNGLDEKNYNAKELAGSIKDVVNNISNVRDYDGRNNKIIVTDRYVYFDYIRKTDDGDIFDSVIIDKSKNSFYFIKENEMFLDDVTSFSITESGIKKQVYSDVEKTIIYDEESISLCIALLTCNELERNYSVA